MLPHALSGRNIEYLESDSRPLNMLEPKHTLWFRSIKGSELGPKSRSVCREQFGAKIVFAQMHASLNMNNLTSTKRYMSRTIHICIVE